MRLRTSRPALVLGPAVLLSLAALLGVLRRGGGELQIRSGPAVPAPDGPSVPAPVRPPGGAEVGGAVGPVAQTVPSGGGPSRGGEAPAALVGLTDDGRVVLLDTTTGRELRVLARHPEVDPERGPRLEGVSVAPDGRSAYYGLAGGCGQGTIYRVALDGGAAPAPVAHGIAPAVSPDGTRLAYAGLPLPGPSGTSGGEPASAKPTSAKPTGAEPADVERCFDAVVVRELDTGLERRWPSPPDFFDGAVTKIAWAPDSVRLAFVFSYEGDGVAVLDTASHAGLAQAAPVLVDGAGGDTGQPAWRATDGRLAVVTAAFDCCFSDSYTGPPRTVVVDPATGAPEDLLPPGRRPTWLDYDATGRHLLVIDDDRLLRRTDDGPLEPLGQGLPAGQSLIAADW